MAKNAPRYNYPVANKGDALEPLECITFFIPSGWWNRASIIGAFYQMGYAFMWPDDEYGLQTAAAWRNAYWSSREINYMAQVDVEVVNHINVDGCGCCGSSGAKESVQAQIDAQGAVDTVDGAGLPSIAGTSEIPPYMGSGGIVSVQQYDIERCRRANWVADKIESNVEKINSVFTSIQGDFVDNIVERAIAGITVAMADTPAPGFADVAGFMIVFAPSFVAWAVSALFPADVLGSTGLVLDKKALVAKVYQADTATELGDLNAQFLEPAIDALGVSDSLKSLWKTYNSFVWGSRFGNWLYANTEYLFTKVIPSDYPITNPCNDSTVQWLPVWRFPTNMQGWRFENLSNVHTRWEAIEGSEPGVNDGGPYAVVTDNTNGGTPFSFDLVLDVPPGSWTPFQSEGIKITTKNNEIGIGSRDMKARIEYATGESDEIDFGNMPFEYTSKTIEVSSENQGMEVTKIIFTMHSDGNSWYTDESPNASNWRVCQIERV